jgi:peroxiredoxin
MKLAPGNQAPDFSTTDIHGQPVSLGQFRGRPLLLMFFRFASCPMCNLRLHDFGREYSRLHEKGLAAVAFFHSSTQAIKKNAGRRSYPFALVPDPNQEIYRDFGVTSSWVGLLKSMVLPSFYWDWMRAMRHGFWGGADLQMAKMPADFLVGPDGRLLLVHYGRDIGNHLPTADIERSLTELPQGK